MSEITVASSHRKRRDLVALELTLTFSAEVVPLEELATAERLNVPLVPPGNPLPLRFTVLGPFTCVIVTVYVPVEPRFTVSEADVAVIVKSAEAVTGPRSRS